MADFEATSKDMEGIVNQLLITKGVECAVFMYQTAVWEYKVSLRSKGRVNVAAIAAALGGGGHVRAAGVTMKGNYQDILAVLSQLIARELRVFANNEVRPAEGIRE